MKREEVVRGLEACAAMSGDECRKCPYGHECRDADLPYGIPHLASDALALLREQEARVLDWNEIGTVDGAVWLEDRDENEVVPGLVMQMHSAVNLDIKKDGKLHTASASRSDYGERWRAWSARPTEEQRKAVPWNG